MIRKTLNIEVLKELAESMTIEQLVNHISFVLHSAEKQTDDVKDEATLTSENL